MKKKLPAVSVAARASFLKDQSDVASQKFTWTYEITVKNDSEEIVQLLNRCWIITDLSGKVEEVRGTGVIGLQPIIKPGKEFVYTSFCQLAMPQGTMEGFYELQDLNDSRFFVDIPKFILTAPPTMTGVYRSILH